MNWTGLKRIDLMTGTGQMDNRERYSKVLLDWARTRPGVGWCEAHS